MKGALFASCGPEGGVTRFTYDDAGNLLTVKDPVNNTTTYSYDGVGRMTMETNQLDDARSYYYDSLGRVAKVLDRNERATQFDYDGMDRVTHEKWYDDASPVPTITIATTTDGGLTDEVQRVGFSDDMGMLGSGTFTLTFDGQTTSGIAWDADAATVQSALEGLSNIDAGEVSVSKTIDWMDTQEWQITFAAGLAGTNVAQTTVDSSNVWGMGTISDIEATDTQGGSSNNEVQTVTLANEDDGVLRLAFLGQTTAEIDFDATAAEVESALEDLNSIDNVTVTGSAGGPWTVTFVGTHAGADQPRMNGDAAALTSGTKIRDISYTYDAASQLTAASDADSTYAYTYDYLGRVLTVDNNGTSGVPNVVLTSAYDAAGNRTSLAAEIDSTDDFLNTYTYNALHRMTRVDQTEQSGGNTVNEKRVDFSYNAGSQYTEIARFNDTDGGTGDEVATSSFTYDSLGRLTMLDYENGGTDLFTPYEWSYDNIYRITQFVGDDGTTDYEYDKTSQLTDADHDYQSDESYSYDDNGNRTMTGYQTGDNNQLENDGTYSYEYDDEGNRTSRTNDTTNEVTEYEWDHRNRLIQVTEKDEYGSTTKVVEYTYDVLNRRIGKAVDTASPFNMADAEIERYVYDDVTGVASLDGGNVVLDFVDPDGEGSTTIDLERRYLYGRAVDQILAQEDVTTSTGSADRIYWPLGDHLGTVRDLAKNDGTLGEHYEYDSYGNVVSGDTSATRYLFTSREFDEDTGLQYNRARWYDAEVGRWVSEDPIGFLAGDANLARYVSSIPHMGSDPSGLAEVYPVGSTIAQVVVDWVGSWFQGEDSVELQPGEGAPLYKPGGPSDLPDHLDGRWEITIAVDDFHAWIWFENVETGETVSLGNYPQGYGGRVDAEGNVLIPPTALPRVQMNQEGARAEGMENGIYTVRDKPVIIDKPKIFKDDTPFTYNLTNDNCVTYACAAWLFYSGENLKPPLFPHPALLENRIDAINNTDTRPIYVYPEFPGVVFRY